MNLMDLKPFRRPLYKMLLQVAQARCKGGPDYVAERDAAVALGFAPVEPRHNAIPEALLQKQEEAAERLRRDILQETGQRMAVALLAENVWRCSDEFAERCPARELSDCPRRHGHRPPLGQRQMWSPEDR
jgi:hypothetical protein